jgi:hypothetical protein
MNENLSIITRIILIAIQIEKFNETFVNGANELILGFRDICLPIY